MKKRKTKRQKITLAQKRRRLTQPTKAVKLKAKTKPRQVANTVNTARTVFKNPSEKNANNSIFLEQTRLIKQDLAKSILLSFFILLAELVLYWRLV